MMFKLLSLLFKQTCEGLHILQISLLCIYNKINSVRRLSVYCFIIRVQQMFVFLTTFA